MHTVNRAALIMAGICVAAIGIPTAAVATVASSAASATSATAAGWHATEAPQPRTAVTAAVDGATCRSATSCVATLDYYDTIGGAGHDALLTGSGSQWSLARSLLPRPADAVPGGGYGLSTDITCFSATSCIGVGSYQSRTGYQGLIVTGHGTTWTAIEAPLPANAATEPVDGQQPGAGLDAVDCPTASLCLAAGTYTDKTGASQVVFLEGSGNKWTATQAPGSDAAGFTNLAVWSIACSAADRCLAAGVDTAASAADEVVLFTWAGKSWSRSNTSPPTPATVEAIAVSCPAATACGAAFVFTDGTSSGSDVLIVTATGSGWRSVRAPLPARGTSDPDGTIEGASFACVAGGHCLWGMEYTNPKGDLGIAVDTGYGTEWTATPMPLPADAAIAQSPTLTITNLACASASACVFAGQYEDKSGDGQVFLLTGHGASWTAARAPMPANAAQVPVSFDVGYFPPQVLALTCLSATECVVGGEYPLKSGKMAGLLLTGPA